MTKSKRVEGIQRIYRGEEDSKDIVGFFFEEESILYTWNRKIYRLG